MTEMTWLNAVVPCNCDKPVAVKQEVAVTDRGYLVIIRRFSGVVSHALSISQTQIFFCSHMLGWTTCSVASAHPCPSGLKDL